MGGPRSPTVRSGVQIVTKGRGRDFSWKACIGTYMFDGDYLTFVRKLNYTEPPKERNAQKNVTCHIIIERGWYESNTLKPFKCKWHHSANDSSKRRASRLLFQRTGVGHH